MPVQIELGPHVVSIPEHSDCAPQTVFMPVQQERSPQRLPIPSHGAMPAGQSSAAAVPATSSARIVARATAIIFELVGI